MRSSLHCPPASAAPPFSAASQAAWACLASEALPAPNQKERTSPGAITICSHREGTPRRSARESLADPVGWECHTPRNDTPSSFARASERTRSTG